MDSHAYEEYRALQDSGVKVGKKNVGVRYNAGGESETFVHSTAKNLVAHIALLNGYRVDSEVEVSKNRETIGEIDVLVWGHPERLSYAVELETSPEDGILKEKQAKYVDGTAVDDIQLINISECPMHMIDAAEWLAEQIGVEV